MLTLPIKKKWSDVILSGEKKEEYREILQNVPYQPEQAGKNGERKRISNILF